MVTMNLIGSYNYTLVALSVLIAMFASYAALDLAGRVTAAGGWTRAVWLLGGAGAMGTGIWSMHYIGMLAFSLPIPVAYHWPTVLLSLLAAILASITALYVVSRKKMSAFQAVAGSILMGAGIASMHYIGMAAMRLPAVCQFNSFLVVLSVVFAVLISLAAVWITFHFRHEKTGIGQEKLAGAVVMGAAIPVMHYTGMAAASFTPSGVPVDLSHAVSISALGTAGIATVTFIVLGLALLTSSVDRRFAAQTLELQDEKLRRNEAYLAEAQRLSHTGSFGWKPSTGEIIWSEETFRIFQYDRTTTPTIELILQRVHLEDAALVQQTIERATQDKKDFDHEYRLMMPDGSLKHLHVVARALNGESGAVEFVGAVMDVTDRKRAAEALLRTEAYLAEGQKLSHTGTWACNMATREMIHSSEEHRHLFGLVPEGGIPPFEEFYQRIHPDDRGQIVGDLERAMAAGTNVVAHFRVVLPEGTTRYMYGIGHPLVKPSGETGEFVGSVMDVTAAKQSEEALRQSESYLAEAQRLSHTGSGAWRVPEGDALYLSEEWYRIYGFDPKQGLSAWKDRLPRMHPEDRAKVEEAKDRAIREKSDYEVDHRILLPDGTVKYTHNVGHPLLNASGDVVQFVCTMMDVTERKRAEEKLRQSEAYLAEAQKLTHTGSWVWDVAKRRALHISEEWYCIYGFDPEQGMLTWEQREERIHPDDRARQRQAIERAINEKSDYDIEYRILLPDGSIRHLHSVGHPVLDASGNLVQFVGSSTDITERRQAEEALRQTRADLARVSRITTMGELTASLAHEVNQPIAAAVTDANTCMRWLTRDQPNLEEAREAASRVAKDASRAADIIRRIRLVFKKGSPQRELVDINEVVREMVVLLRSEATPYSVSIQTELAELPQIMADRVQLQQVLMNLMINAVDAMKDVVGPRTLIIRSQQAEDGQVIVSTSDTGVGLPPQQADQIFNAFFTTKPHGTGMGLRISRSIIESHGGRLWAADNSPRGASFCFSLPTKAEAEEDTQSRSRSVRHS
jgi:PAS domain S-box-containing protein